MKTNGKIQLFPFLRITLMLIIGICVGDALSDIAPALVWLVIIVCLTVSLCLIKRKPVLETCLIFCSFFFIGIWLDSLHNGASSIKLPDTDVEYEAVLTSQPVEKGKVIKCDLMVTRCNGNECKHPFRVKATILRDTIEQRYKCLQVGDGIVAYSLLVRPENFYSHSNFDYKRWLQVHGFVAQTFIYYDCWQKSAINISSVSRLERVKIKALKLRQHLISRYEQLGLDGQQQAILSAMTLGDKSKITKDMKDYYSISGASHILALSGLHLSIIYAILMLFFPRRRFRMLSQCLSLVCIWTYVFIVGMAPSVVRAAMMISVYAFTSLLNRDKMSVNTLALTAFIMLLVNPLNLWDVGFQMSFMAVLSIFVFYGKFYHLLPDRVLQSSLLIRCVWGMLSVSMSAQIGTFPLVMFYFGRFSCYFLLTNLLVIPFATVILYSAFAMFVFTPLIIVQKYIAMFLLVVVRWMNIGVMSIASLPYASIENININRIQLLAIYVLIVAMYCLCHYIRKMYKISRIY